MIKKDSKNIFSIEIWTSRGCSFQIGIIIMLRLPIFKYCAKNIVRRNSDISLAKRLRLRSVLNNSGGQVSAILDC